METVKNMGKDEFVSKVGENQETNDLINKKSSEADIEQDSDEIQVKEVEDGKELEEKKEEPVDAIIKVIISADSLNAFINIEPPKHGGSAPTYEMIMKALMDKKVIHGIDTSLIKGLLENELIYNENLLVAKGLPPIHDQDAELKFHFPVTKDIKPQINENGTVNFHEMGIVQNISIGKVLCTKTPVVKGAEGKTVTGAVIKQKKGVDKPLPVGKNTIASEDHLQVISDSDGQVDYINKKINILDTFRVKGNVGSETGDIEFVGNVVISGNVQSGYSVYAGGNVRVEGLVEAAHIRAEGSISICSGMNGMGKGVLESKENINCKYMENSIAIARGTIVSESMLNCQVRCGVNLELIGRRGMIVGGCYTAGQDVLAKTIGSEAYTHTEIEIGKDPALHERLNKLNEEIPQKKKEINDLQKIVDYLQQLESVGKLTEEKKELLKNAGHTKQIKYEELNASYAEKEESLILLEKKSKGKIVCTDKIYPGAIVSIGIAKMSINNIFKNCILRKKEGAIIISQSE